MKTIKRTGAFESICKGLNNLSFKGRSRRSEFWWSALCLSVIYLIISCILDFLPLVGRLFLIVANLFILYLSLALICRRLHDIGLSGKSIILFYIPYIIRIFAIKNEQEVLVYWMSLLTLIAWVVLAVLCCLDSHKETNNYGKSPKYLVDIENFQQEYNDMNREESGRITTSSILNGCLSGLGIGGCLVIALLPLIIGVVAAHFLCNINPEESYCWYHGIWHGLFIIPNWIMSWFDSDILCKAPNATWGYYVWWWIMLIGEILSFLSGGNRQRY